MASLFHQILLFFLLQLPFLISAQTYSNVSLGSSISTLDKNPSWNSPSGEFAFGFHPIKGEDLFLLAIWFTKTADQTIVWTANQGKAVQRGSKVELTTKGVLSLSSPNGTVIWKAEQLSGKQATSAAMLNSGNFLLTSNDSIIWETFSAPTDTMLPGQTLDVGGTLISRATEENYTQGRFQLILRNTLGLYPIIRPTNLNYDAYWSIDTGESRSQLVFNQSGHIYLSLTNGTQLSVAAVIPDSTKDFYHRVTLDFYGVLRQYKYPKSSNSRQSWTSIWSQPQDICLGSIWDYGSGVCGFNSYCQQQDGRPTCKCPPGYLLSDQNNVFGGCKQEFLPQSCDADKVRLGTSYEMKQIPGVDWPKGGDYEWFQGVSEESCKETCLSDCLCAVAITRDGSCWLKKFPLSNGRLNPGSKDMALIKVGNSSTEAALRPVFENKNVKNGWIIPGSILLGSSVFLNLLLLLLIAVFFFLSFHKKQFKSSPEISTLEMNLRCFSYKELEEATDGFKEELGQGAYSTVYKGRLQSVTGSFVAIKRLNKIVREADKEFTAEVSAIGRTNHRNLVKLIGFCNEEANRLLVYEYMRNGSLADLLFGSSRPEWYLRIQTAFGIARGLAYLHEDCCSQIIHCDVKPQNILLDDTYTAKISDFGLAKLLKSDQSRTNTDVRGTRGYVAPEWFKSMAITAKVDVYSFGIMLLEIICCRKNCEQELGTEDIDLLSEWAYECCVEKKVDLLVKNDEDAKNDRRLERLVMVAMSCIQEDPSLRPSMKKVTQMLEGAVEVSMPKYPSSFKQLSSNHVMVQ